MIFTSGTNLTLEKIKKERAFKNLFVDVKAISAKKAFFKKIKNDLWMLRVHGADKSGLVYAITQCLSESSFSISRSRNAHRTAGRVPGYILLIEGEPAAASTKNCMARLGALSMKLKTHISFYAGGRRPHCKWRFVHCAFFPILFCRRGVHVFPFTIRVIAASRIDVDLQGHAGRIASVWAWWLRRSESRNKSSIIDVRHLKRKPMPLNHGFIVLLNPELIHGEGEQIPGRLVSVGAGFARQT